MYHFRLSKTFPCSFILIFIQTTLVLKYITGYLHLILKYNIIKLGGKAALKSASVFFFFIPLRDVGLDLLFNGSTADWALDE